MKKVQPQAFEEAKKYEKTAIEHGSPFSWSDRETLVDLEDPKRIAAIEKDHQQRLKRAASKRRGNPLLDGEDLIELDIDELYGEEQGRGACLMCHR